MQGSEGNQADGFDLLWRIGEVRKGQEELALRRAREYCLELIQLVYDHNVSWSALDTNLIDIILGEDWSGSLVPRHVMVYDSDLADEEVGGDPDCTCGHPYHRHFDWVEHNAPVGCKYCSCRWWEDPQTVKGQVVTTTSFPGDRTFRSVTTTVYPNGMEINEYELTDRAKETLTVDAGFLTDCDSVNAPFISQPVIDRIVAWVLSVGILLAVVILVNQCA